MLKITLTRLRIPHRWLWLSAFAAGCLPCLLTAPAASIPPTLCRIEIVDQENGWPVPLVELRTTHHLRFVTDNAGVIAFGAPELMGRETWFTVIGHGYGVAKDGFGYRGVRLTPEPGKTLRIEVKRDLPAKRLGRLTGGGLFAESRLCGENWEELENGVLGCDSVQNAVYGGKLFWAWGDTTFANYPLGEFHMTSATTPLQPLKSFRPPLSIDFQYFTDENGRARSVAKMPGTGPTWVSGYTSLPDKDGQVRLVGTYVKIKPPLEAYELGFCVWNEDTSAFERLKVLWTQSNDAPKHPPAPMGHPVLWKDERGTDWVLFGDPLPKLRCASTFEAWQNPDAWELLKPQESMPSADGQRRVKPHSGSIAWNEFRKRWVTVFMEAFGEPSTFGELWYAEADSPLGPWGPAVKVVTHENYTFYNPRLHPEFTAPDSPILIFEGTYTMQFTDNKRATPRYDYNQILYRLDLDDPALAKANP